MHQRNRVGIKSSTWHSGTKTSKKEMALLKTPFTFQRQGVSLYLREDICKSQMQSGLYIVMGSGGESKNSQEPGAAPSQGPSKVVIFHALLILQIL